MDKNGKYKNLPTEWAQQLNLQID